MNISDAAEAFQQHVQAVTFAHNVGHAVRLFIVSWSLLFVIESLNELFRSVSEETSHAVHDPHGFLFAVFRQPNLAINVTNGQIQTHDLVADEQFHARVVFQQGNQLAILTNFVLDVAHQRAETWFGAVVRIALHST